MKNKSQKETEEFLKIFHQVLATFSEIQDASTLNKSNIMDLFKLYQQNPYFFDKALEQTFLKIFKCFNERANKKIPAKFQTVIELLFKQIMKNTSDESIRSLNQFCDFLSQAILSQIMNIRIMGSRMMFLILKGLPNSANLFTQKTQNTIGKSVLFLLKQKVSTYRQLGIKLSSSVSYSRSEYRSSIQNQLFKILSTEENQMIRKMVMTNIPINSHNIDKLLIRLRDRNAQIRATLLRRLLTQNYRLEKLKLNSIYKILYDGYGTKDIICKEQALRYFISYFKNPQVQNQNKFQMFVELFQPNLLLINSHLLVLFNRLINQLLNILPVPPVSEYILKLCNKVKASLKDRNYNISSEIIWLKSSTNFRVQAKQINNVFEEYGPSGTQLAQLLVVFIEKKNLFVVNQILQIFTNIKMPDQIGRNKMFNSLKSALSKLSYFQLKLDLHQINKNDDICNIQTPDQIRLRKFMLSYYDIPIISNSIDLIYPIISAMKYLRPQSFSLQIQQTISDWENPDEYPVLQQKGIAERTLNQLRLNPEKLGAKNPEANIKQFQQKLQKMDQQIEFLKYKTVVAVACVSKIQYDFNLEPYMTLIKEQLGKQDQSYGIYLLGLYCLGDIEKIKMFFPLYWNHIMSVQPNSDKNSKQYQQYKLNITLSLKLMTDFVVKFNILNSDDIMNNSSTDQSTIYNSDIFMERMTQLILHKDTDIRIFSIQCLCRMIYHNRVDQNNISTYFLYLLLLWWETSTEEVSAKSVHTISLFFRSYIQKGNQQVKKLAQMLCIFHKILKIFEQKEKTINKNLIIYNLKITQFIKKTVSIATTVLKYHKQKKTIWTYEQPELGPQEFFLLYLLYEPGFQNILQKPINISDFYVKCPLQTLIFVKKKLQKFQEQVQEDSFFPSAYRYQKIVTKKSLEQINRFEKQIQTHISVKNEQTFNEEIINTLEKIFSESCKYINEEAKRIAKNIQEEQIFVNIDSDNQDLSNQNSISDSEQSQQQIDYISESVASVPRSQKIKISQSQNIPRKANKTVKQPKKNLKRKQMTEQPSSESSAQQEQVQIQQEEKPSTLKKKSRKRVPSDQMLNSKQIVQFKSDDKKQENQPVRSTRARKPIF